ncbi:beta-carotene hydroxylase [Sphingomonas piscis]|uniref:Beta-carotene hydroxylase n=1 Tax=Sphingomonas piscis TaxID=2714943 RepID=A0A6G7YSD5_9SPHN|nr:sterol desaturase family protein [Sphingomonas piscis]QIK79658.1 beta-carotene hydroxylase [Sphingomonas piscis]
MGLDAFVAAGVVIATVIAMEVFATLIHRFVMHGVGWGWHRSHHEPSTGWFERNDLYAMIFSLISVGLFIAGNRWPLLWWAGVGTVVYGLLYVLVHDGMVHRRIPFPRRRLGAYGKRLVQAHRLHHSVRERDGGVSFGFLYAPPVASLLARLKGSR